MRVSNNTELNTKLIKRMFKAYFFHQSKPSFFKTLSAIGFHALATDLG